MARNYTLKGSVEKENIERRISYLKLLFNNAANKEIHVTEIRQRNLNYALIIFAGLFSISWTLPLKTYSLSISFTLFLIMLVFCLIDRKYHKFIHGWRKSRKIFNDKINEIINNPTIEVSFPRYAKEAENEAEIFGLHPIISYLLVMGGLIRFLYFFINMLASKD